MHSGSSTGDAASPVAADDRQVLLKATLADFARRTHFPIAFGGFVEGDQVIVSQLVGNRGNTLRGLAVHAGWGLGGRVLQEGRPRLTSDYGASRIITHDYDRPVLAEGIATLFAVPVMVGLSTQAVLYGGLRTSLGVGGVTVDPAVAVARELAARLTPATQQHSPVATNTAPAGSAALGAAPVEELRRLYADVRTITAGLTDPALRAQLEGIEERIVTIARGAPAAAAVDSHLTARESDVLSLVALGCSNAAVGRTIGVTEATVKGYMNSAMHKLGASTRFEAVVFARRAHLLP